MRLLPLLLTLCLPIPVLAQSAPPSPSAPVRRMMADMDADHDGFVSRDEFQAAHRRADQGFDQLDSNHDAVLSRDEFLAGGSGGQGRAERFRVLDSNSDGRITREELEARHNARFESMDGDHDGKLSAQEMRSAPNAMRRDALDPNAR